MIQYEDNTKYLRIGQGGLLENNVIWGAQIKNNGLYKINLDRKKVEWDREFPNDIYNGVSYTNPIHDKEYLYFIPFDGEELVTYNLLKGEMEKINVKKDKNAKYAVGVIRNGEIFLFPANWSQEIAIIQQDDKKVIFQNNMLHDLEQFLGEKVVTLFWNSYVYKENIYLPIHARSVVVEYNYNTKEYGFYWIDQIEDNGIRNCEGRGEKLYLLDIMGGVYVFDVNTKEVQKIFKIEARSIRPYISLHLFKDDEIWLIPFAEKEIVIYNIRTKEITIQNIIVDDYKICEDENSLAVRNEYKFSKVFRQDDILWLYPNATNLLIKVDMKTREQEGFSVALPQDRVALLDNFVSNSAKENIDKQSNNCGKEIWKRIKD